MWPALVRELGSSACWAPPLAWASWAAPRWAPWPRSGGEGSPSSSPPPSPRPTRCGRCAGCRRRTPIRDDRPRRRPRRRLPRPGTGVRSGSAATFALFGERRLGLHLASTGGVFAAIGVVIVAVQVGLVRPAIRRLGEEGTLRTGLALTGLGLLLLAGVHSKATVVPPLLLATIGQGLVTPSLSSSVAGRAGSARRGAALGIQQSAGGLARVVGPIAGGALFQHIGVSSPYLVGAGLLGLAVALASASSVAGVG